MAKDMSHLEGKRTGRPPGKAKQPHQVLHPDLRWVLDNLDKKDVKFGASAARTTILKWAREDRSKFMDKVMRILLTPHEPRVSEEKKYSSDQCVKVVDELLAGFKRSDV